MMNEEKHLLSLKSFSKEDIYYLISTGIKEKKEYKPGKVGESLKGKLVALLFEKQSTRTRVSFEAAIFQLGGSSTFLSSDTMQLKRGETVEDTAQVLSRYIDAVVIRTFSQEILENYAKYSKIPVINGLTDKFHPCQILADLMTVYEKKGKLSGLKLTYLGDGNNIANSLLIGCSKVGIDISVATPKGHKPDSDVIELAKEIANDNSKVIITENPREAIENSDVVYSDVWSSMGQKTIKNDNRKLFLKYQVNVKLLTFAKKDAIFMHCLPAHRGEEVTRDVFEGKKSIVFDQAENRLHLQKAVLKSFMG